MGWIWIVVIIAGTVAFNAIANKIVSALEAATRAQAAFTITLNEALAAIGDDGPDDDPGEAVNDNSQMKQAA